MCPGQREAIDIRSLLTVNTHGRCSPTLCSPFSYGAQYVRVHMYGCFLLHVRTLASQYTVQYNSPLSIMQGFHELAEPVYSKLSRLVRKPDCCGVLPTFCSIISLGMKVMLIDVRCTHVRMYLHMQIHFCGLLV